MSAAVLQECTTRPADCFCGWILQKAQLGSSDPREGDPRTDQRAELLLWFDLRAPAEPPSIDVQGRVDINEGPIVRTYHPQL